MGPPDVVVTTRARLPSSTGSLAETVQRRTREDAHVADAIGSAFHETVEEGHHRLNRTWPALLATGFVGGVDVSVGLLGMLLVKAHSGSDVLAALAFSIGFIALTLARSELFTENFMVPISAVVAGQGRMRDVWRLWGGTAVTNLLGGMVMVSLIMTANPDLGETAIETGSNFVERGIGLQGLSSAILAGVVITLMTWMQHATPEVGARIVAAIGAAFLLSYGHLSHVIVASLEIYAGILGGADFGYAEWFGMFWLWAVGNAIGGLGFVTILRLVQVGSRRLQEAQKREIEPEGTPRDDDEKRRIADGTENEKRENGGVILGAGHDATTPDRATEESGTSASS